jgi:hypothetical protein
MMDLIADEDHRTVDELLTTWPDYWERFSSVVGGYAMVQDKDDSSALKSLVTGPVQEMLKVSLTQLFY